MTGSREAYVGIGAAKSRNAVAIAEEGRDGEVRYLGEFDAAPESMRRLVTRLAAKYGRFSRNLRAAYRRLGSISR